MILSLQTTSFSAFGGIPTYNRLICRALNETGSSNVLVATDKKSDVATATADLPNLKIEAFDSNRMAFVRRVFGLALGGKFQIALMGHVNYSPLGWLLRRLQPSCRYGVILYGIEAWKPLPWLRRRALQEADFVISISDYTKRKAIAENGLKPERVFLLPNAVESDCDPLPTSGQQREYEGICLLSVCRLDQREQYKGVDKVIEVLKDLANQVPEIRYTVVGAGSDLIRHKRLAQTLGVEHRVEFLGSVDNATLQRCYSDCDIFVLPSAGEGFGFVFLEAMQHAKPIIAARSGGAPEVVTDTVTGVLVEYGDREQLAAALLGLCLDSGKREALGRAGYVHLQDQFTFKQFQHTFREILSQQMLTNGEAQTNLAQSDA